jgi:NADH-quinone oxidoreductase subunit G
VLLLDIHEKSEINQPEVHLNELPGPAVGKTFNGEPLATGHNVTDVKIGAGPNTEGTDSTNPNVEANV